MWNGKSANLAWSGIFFVCGKKIKFPTAPRIKENSILYTIIQTPSPLPIKEDWINVCMYHSHFFGKFCFSEIESENGLSSLFPFSFVSQFLVKKNGFIINRNIYFLPWNLNFIANSLSWKCQWFSDICTYI